MKAVFGAFVLALMVTMTVAPEAEAAATCFCVISKNNLTNQHSQSGVCKDLTAEVNTQYTGINQQSDTNQTDCNQRCTAKAAPYTGSQAIASACCAIGATNSPPIRAYSAVGTKEYKTAQQIGVLTNTPQVTATTCTCPTGWLANQTNVDGGVTADGKCKKPACGPITVTPFPADYTPVGSGPWGFTGGNTLYAFGSTANGGAAKCVTAIKQAAVCKF